jgi:hypothetical protein
MPVKWHVTWELWFKGTSVSKLRESPVLSALEPKT